jgi:hypothetical protein
MSDDPHTRAQIAEIAHSHRPLVVCDVDEVVLEFVAPFQRWLGERNLYLSTESFRLTGNIRDRNSHEPVAQDTIGALIDGYFADQQAFQRAVAGCVDALTRIACVADIVLLTAMPHRHRETRRALLDREGLPFPLITTEAAKGPAVVALRGSNRPVAFLDDLPHNHLSVAEHVPGALLIHLMAFKPLLAVMPKLPAGIIAAEDWNAAEVHIHDHFARIPS